jgi:ABC-2 type transport system ATP-binding protein
MIRVKNLTKYFGPVKAVDNITFNVKEGEILGFLGPNGAGKSTTLRIITCFIPPTSGTVTVGPYDIFRNSRQVREIIGYLPESAPLYPEMRVYEYLTFRAALKGVPSRRIGDRLEAVMGLTNITDVRDKICGHLSKGYRQRVGIADCLLHEPRVLILDEPTVGLDPLQIRETRTMFQNLRHKCTIVISTHILSEVELTCDRALVIHRGRIVAEETIANLTEVRTIRLTIQRPGGMELAGALTAVKGLAAVADAHGEVLGDEFQLTIQCKGTRDARTALAVKAQEMGWRVLEMHPAVTSLEDVFRRLIREEGGTREDQFAD